MKNKMLVTVLLLLLLARVALAAEELESGQLYAGVVTVSPNRNDMVALSAAAGELHIYVQGAIESTIEFTAYVGGATTGQLCRVHPDDTVVPGSIGWRVCSLHTPFAADHVLLRSDTSQTIELVVSDGTWAPPTYDYSVYIPLIQ